MTSKTVSVLNPISIIESRKLEIAPRLSDLEGKVVGLLDNGKPNAERLLNEIACLIGQRYNLTEVVRKRKNSQSGPCSPEMFDDLIQRCDLIINAMGD